MFCGAIHTTQHQHNSAHRHPRKKQKPPLATAAPSCYHLLRCMTNKITICPNRARGKKNTTECSTNAHGARRVCVIAERTEEGREQRHARCILAQRERESSDQIDQRRLYWRGSRRVYAWWLPMCEATTNHAPFSCPRSTHPFPDLLELLVSIHWRLVG